MLKNSFLKPAFKPSIGVSGEYRMVVRRAADRSIVRDTGWFENLITDAGLNRLGSGGWHGHCHIGTGTTTPANGDTALAAQAASTNSSQILSPANSGSPLYKSTTTIVYRFTAGALNGNYTEVGISWGNTTLFSRALIVDGGGSPTSITVTSSEYLDVYYRLSMVPDLTDSTYSCTISGVTYSVTRRAGDVSNAYAWVPANSAWIPCGGRGGSWTIQGYTGTLGAVTGGPNGSGTSSFNVATPGSYSNNSYQRTSSMSFGLGDLNVSGGIKTLYCHDTVGSWQHEFTPVIPKDDTKIMTLSFSLSWGRA